MNFSVGTVIKFSDKAAQYMTKSGWNFYVKEEPHFVVLKIHQNGLHRVLDIESLQIHTVAGWGPLNMIETYDVVEI